MGKGVGIIYGSPWVNMKFKQYIIYKPNTKSQWQKVSPGLWVIPLRE